jgi:hypothetical protein
MEYKWLTLQFLGMSRFTGLKKQKWYERMKTSYIPHFQWCFSSTWTHSVAFMQKQDFSISMKGERSGLCGLSCSGTRILLNIMIF